MVGERHVVELEDELPVERARVGAKESPAFTEQSSTAKDTANVSAVDRP